MSPLFQILPCPLPFALVGFCSSLLREGQTAERAKLAGLGGG